MVFFLFLIPPPLPSHLFLDLIKLNLLRIYKPVWITPSSQRFWFLISTRSGSICLWAPVLQQFPLFLALVRFILFSCLFIWFDFLFLFFFDLLGFDCHSNGQSALVSHIHHLCSRLSPPPLPRPRCYRNEAHRWLNSITQGQSDLNDNQWFVFGETETDRDRKKIDRGKNKKRERDRERERGNHVKLNRINSDWSSSFLFFFCPFFKLNWYRLGNGIWRSGNAQQG